MNRLTPSLSDLLARLTQLEERTNRAEERAAKAEARAAQLENATGNLAAAMVDPKSISRRNLLMKVAGVGAAGVAGSLILNRKDAHAAFTWNGGTTNTADLQTTVIAGTGYASNSMLRVDATTGANAYTNGLYGLASGSGYAVVGLGGNLAGTGVYGAGGPATGTGSSGNGGIFYAGATAAGQAAGSSLQAYQLGTQPGKSSTNVQFGASSASDKSAFSNGLRVSGADRGYGTWSDGGGGNALTPPTGGGVGIYGNSGPGNVGVVGYGDGYNTNTTIEAHGTAGFGNAKGVGGWFSGGRAALALGSTGTAGPPTTLQHYVGDIMLDVNMVIWVCIANGIPGTWQPLQPGGMSNALYTAVSNNQYTLASSDGATWANMDSTLLKLSITPTFNCMAILSAGADLWTFNPGFNQDIGIAISGGAYPTIAGQPEGWKESGGYAGTFSPNAAFVQTIVPLLAGGVYTIQVVWKANKGGASTIAAGAGPIGTPAKFSPTRLTAQLVATKAGGAAMPLGPAAPYQIPASMRPPAEQRPMVIPAIRKP
jgi:hypothetical protein